MKDIHLENPFVNDMFGLVYLAFKNLYPDKTVQCEWVPECEPADDGEEVLGVTTFSEDGIFVEISAKLPVMDAVEIFAHELAHVAVGSDADHGTEWEAAFDAIFDEYNRLGYEFYPEHNSTPVTSGKDYIRSKE